MLRLLHGLNRALVVCAVLLLAGTICFAQESRGSITGKVLDPAGAVIPGAKVTITDVGTNVSSALTSNSTGYWEVNFLTPGEYSVTVEAAGFKMLKQTGITLDTGNRLALDMKLEIGDTSVSVTVNADAPLLNSTTASTGRVLNTQDMADLPFGQMNPMVLQAMAAGMIFTGSLQPDNNRALDHASTANYASGGLGTGLNEFLLDGNPTTGTNGGRSGYVALSDAVDEVRVETSPFDASMGHAIGAFISLTTKAGTNVVHGGAPGRCNSSAGTPPRSTPGRPGWPADPSGLNSNPARSRRPVSRSAARFTFPRSTTARTASSSSYPTTT